MEKLVQKPKKGFTLVELSIVLVIIGLLIGGVLVGQSLIESAKINALIRQIGQYQILVSQFQQKFRFLPGDIPNAQDLFGAGTGSGSQTCNGNGDGMLQNNWTLGINGCDSNNNHREPLYVSEHLYLGGFVKDEYVGVNGGSNTYLKIAFDKKAQFAPEYGSNNITNISSRNGFRLSSSNYYNGAVLTTTQALSVDKKLDDGLPSYGDVFGMDGTITSGAPSDTTRGACTNGRTWGGLVGSSTTRVYDSTTAGLACTMFFPMKMYSN